ncbi:MAG: SpoIVB peptidase, partial [Clostridia bacterium]|nr:SpoIVB peptidase [Clostridia bacterium]
IDINCSEDITRIMQTADVNNIELMLVRNGNTIITNSQAVKDSISGEYKLGISVSDATDGIGTLTFVDSKDNRYGALGHPISEIYGKDGSNSVGGFICEANIFSVYKGEKNRAGELVGNLVKDVKLGSIDKNETQGIFGEYTGDTSNLKKVYLASSRNVKPGKAQIVTSAFTGKPTYYDIEIIKACRQEKDKPKGILYRVTDQKLIGISGGIVQGMSGCPIIQKGKLIGAVTHVFLADSTKGYGTYIDWMIDK